MIAEEHRRAARGHYLGFAEATGFLGAVIDLRNRLLSEDEVRGTLEGRRMRD
jgi:hypothetical protein